jgi:hypothetical protein
MESFKGDDKSIKQERSENRSLNSSQTATNMTANLERLSDLPEPKSPYGAITHGVRRIMPQEIACRVGCGGKSCKYDNSKDWQPEQMAIDGIFSHWYCLIYMLSLLLVYFNLFL